MTQAALFVEKVLRFCLDGTKVCALLPDVLRSGTRYQKWREWVIKNSFIEKVEIVGRFDKYADVDVFNSLFPFHFRRVERIANRIPSIGD